MKYHYKNLRLFYWFSMQILLFLELHICWNTATEIFGIFPSIFWDVKARNALRRQLLQLRLRFYSKFKARVFLAWRIVLRFISQEFSAAVRPQVLRGAPSHFASRGPNIARTIGTQDLSLCKQRCNSSLSAARWNFGVSTVNKRDGVRETISEPPRPRESMSPATLLFFYH